ncbi:MAG: transketolase, partial [Spirochaetales bacterium]|nr:transketolase [Spirochaetales bacterium]
MTSRATGSLTEDELVGKSIAYRREVLTYIYEAGAGHTGGSLSCVDIISVLYNSIMDITPENWESLNRDFYIQSKGHSVEALYVVLADQGFLDRSELKTGNRFGTRLVGHPTRKVPGVEHNTGGLGHGLSVAVGLALAAKLDGRASRVFCLLGDGELAEGSNWEAAMTGAHYKLDNLTAIVDRNRLQITGHTEDVNQLEPLAEKWTAFGWTVHETDGNDVAALAAELRGVPFTPGRPSLLIANTLKGKGVSFIEGEAGWHHKVPTREQVEQAMRE